MARRRITQEEIDAGRDSAPELSFSVAPGGVASPHPVESGESEETKETRRESFAILIPPIYHVLGGLEALLASVLMKAPRTDCAEVLSYSEAEIELLTVPTSAVLAKYSGSYMDNHLEEFALILHLASIHQTKLALLQERIADRKAKKAEAETGITPISAQATAS